MDLLDGLFVRTKELIDELSTNCCDSRLPSLKVNLTEKLNGVCDLLRTSAESLYTFNPVLIKDLYKQLRLVIKARNELNAFINDSLAIQELLVQNDGKLTIQSKLHTIMRNKLDKIVDDLKKQSAAEPNMVQEYVEYCYYLAGLNVITFS